MNLFDSHCHLQAPELFPQVRSVLARAASVGVAQVACCGTRPAGWAAVFECAELGAIGPAETMPRVFPMIGIHPWFVPAATDGASERLKNSIQALEKLLKGHPTAGVGETGLDFQSRFVNRQEQAESFAMHLDLARQLDRPVAVHCVHAWGTLLEILRKHSAPRIVLHAFSGAEELIPELIELNCWFSFGGSVTNPRARRVRAAAAAVPAERLLVETDAPDFPPAGSHFPNEPARLIETIQAIAMLRDVPVETIASLTFMNASERVFV